MTMKTDRAMERDCGQREERNKIWMGNVNCKTSSMLDCLGGACAEYNWNGMEHLELHMQRKWIGLQLHRAAKLVSDQAGVWKPLP